MTNKTIEISKEVLNAHSNISVGYMVVGNLHHVASAKGNIFDLDKLMILMADKQINLQNLADFGPVKKWREIYQQCGVKPKTFKSSLESLLRRVIQSDYKHIIPVVDLYNSISAKYMLSVGGYNLKNIRERLILRYGVSTDRFIPINGKEELPITPQQIVYADLDNESPIVCWMWNHKDAKRTMLSNEVENGLFIFDCTNDEDREKYFLACEDFSNSLTALGATVELTGILDANDPLVTFQIN